MQAPPESLYFAYGSNLQLAQMARRCPSSRYMGTAYLQGYRFQINQRGYANIIPSPDDVVAGLCYLLSGDDEVLLDFYEGVKSEAYEKEFLDVETLVARVEIVGRRVSEILGCGLLTSTRDNKQKEMLLSGARVAHGLPKDASHASGEVVKALFYVSRRYTTESVPREEYVGRMNLGIADSLILGLTEEYVDKYIRPYIPPA